MKDLDASVQWLTVCFHLIHLFCSPRLHLFDQKYSKNCEIILQFKITVFYVNIFQNVIYSCDQSWIFSIITPVFSVTWSSEIILICWFAAQETFLIMISVKLRCCVSLWSVGDDLRVCAPQRTCCNTEMEENFSQRSSRDFEKLMDDTSEELRDTFMTRHKRFDGTICSLTFID